MMSVFISESVAVNNIVTCQPASILQEENLRGFCVYVHAWPCVYVHACVAVCCAYASVYVRDV